MIRRNFLAVTLVAPLLTVAQAQISFAQKRSSSKRVLLVGIDPNLVDYSKLPELDAQKLGLILADQWERLSDLGYSVRWCFIDTGPSAHHRVVEILRSEAFDVISIGAGVRVPPENLLLFERLINAVHHHAPQAVICFSKTANDTAEAVQRSLEAV